MVVTFDLREAVVVKHLCLDIISSDNVSNSSQGRGGHLIVSVPATKKQMLTLTGLKHSKIHQSVALLTLAVLQAAGRHQSR